MDKEKAKKLFGEMVEVMDACERLYGSDAHALAKNWKYLKHQLMHLSEGTKGIEIADNFVHFTSYT